MSSGRKVSGQTRPRSGKCKAIKAGPERSKASRGTQGTKQLDYSAVRVFERRDFSQPLSPRQRLNFNR